MQVIGRGKSGQCTIRNDAVGLLLNVTAVGATSQTNLRIFPSDARTPDASNLNPGPGQPPTPNAVTTKLSANGRFSVFNQNGSVNLVIDVVGILVNHNHDDRYYTKSQVDAMTPTLRTVTEEVPVPVELADIYEVSCGPDESAVSGGYSLATGTFAVDDIFVVSSFRGGWGSTYRSNVWAFEVLNYSTNPGTLHLDAQCISTVPSSGSALADDTPAGWEPRQPSFAQAID